MSFSIYTSFFNVCGPQSPFDWEDALLNWHDFLQDSGQIVVAVNKSTDDTLKQVRDFTAAIKRRTPHSRTVFTILDVDVPYTDPEFDGKVKDLALQACTQPHCILLDCDERVLPGALDSWNYFRNKLDLDDRIDAYLIPVIDLFHDVHSYKSVGTKWYLHKNRKHLGRGVVAFARRPDGSIDITKSDTCELINRETKQLAAAAPALMSQMPDFMKVGQLQGGSIPWVYHLGWLDKQKRLKQDALWQPVWQARDGSDVKTAKTIEELNQIRYAAHGLPLWPRYD